MYSWNDWKTLVGSVFYSKDSYLQVKNESLIINFFHYYNLQRQEVYFW
jgi:hypothetical protein